MCGLFGFCVKASSTLPETALRFVLEDLFLFSERRGKEASGYAVHDSESTVVCRSPLPASKMIKSGAMQKISFCFKDDESHVSAVGQTRLVTTGSEALIENNQPIVKSGMICVHNGIIVNDADLWDRYRNEPRVSQVDSELIPTLISLFLKQEKSLLSALRRFFKEIRGTTSTAILFDELDNIILATNNGSLYYVNDPEAGIMVFASERPILESLIKKHKKRFKIGYQAISHVLANDCLCFSPSTASIEVLALDKDLGQSEFAMLSPRRPGRVINNDGPDLAKAPSVERMTSARHAGAEKEIEAHFQHCIERYDRLKRCTKCILPETFPFIMFDDDGICNYCDNYAAPIPLGEDLLLKAVKPHRKKDGQPDCIVGLSGGRDSSYSLHYAKNVLKLNPLAFSYDWGMLTDLGRRNQSRMCAGLGVEHVLYSADIRAKRDFIKKNILAWLKNPSLGVIPLFMAGDKQYFYHAHKLMKRHDIKLLIFGENKLETTFFKHGFCGIAPDFNTKKSFTLSTRDKLKMAGFYLREYLRNPGYLNISMPDTAGAFLSYYVIPHFYINLFDYVKWDERQVVSTLGSRYEWECAKDTESSWRIGDGTTPFYNYIYFTVAGFTENDTFRSNQIRSKAITREEGLRLARRDNNPRYDSIRWYCDTIGIDCDRTLKIVNSIPKLY
jgi:asparagine synthetase B (glutamine-hydrolysing)